MSLHEWLESHEVEKIIKSNNQIIGDRRITPQLILTDSDIKRMNIVAAHIEEVHKRGPLGSGWAQLVAQHTRALEKGEIDLEDLI